MCEADVYLVKEGQEQLIIESVDLIAPEGDSTWRLVNIFGDQKRVTGRIKEMNLVNHKILFEMPAA